MSNNKLKITALIFMLIDHIHLFIPNSPYWLYYIGRVSAPIFFFCIAWGFHYTKNKRVFLIRLYFFGSIMAIINECIRYIIKNDIYLDNNIFVTLFLSCFIIWIIEIYKMDKKRGKRYSAIFIAIQIISTSLIVVGEACTESFIDYRVLISALTANIFFCEGGIYFVALPVILYFIKDKKKSLIYGYSIYCAIYTFIYATDLIPRIIMYSEQYLPEWISSIVYLIAVLFNADYIPSYHQHWYILRDQQWLMILALPFMLLYNGKREVVNVNISFIYFTPYIYMYYT